MLILDTLQKVIGKQIESVEDFYIDPSDVGVKIIFSDGTSVIIVASDNPNKELLRIDL